MRVLCGPFTAVYLFLVIVYLSSTTSGCTSGSTYLTRLFRPSDTRAIKVVDNPPVAELRPYSSSQSARYTLALNVYTGCYADGLPRMTLLNAFSSNKKYYLQEGGFNQPAKLVGHSNSLENNPQKKNILHSFQVASNYNQLLFNSESANLRLDNSGSDVVYSSATAFAPWVLIPYPSFSSQELSTISTSSMSSTMARQQAQKLTFPNTTADVKTASDVQDKLFLYKSSSTLGVKKIDGVDPNIGLVPLFSRQKDTGPTKPVSPDEFNFDVYAYKLYTGYTTDGRPTWATAAVIRNPATNLFLAPTVVEDSGEAILCDSFLYSSTRAPVIYQEVQFKEYHDRALDEKWKSPGFMTSAGTRTRVVDERWFVAEQLTPNSYRLRMVFDESKYLAFLKISETAYKLIITTYRSDLPADIIKYSFDITLPALTSTSRRPDDCVDVLSPVCSDKQEVEEKSVTPTSSFANFHESCQRTPTTDPTIRRIYTRFGADCPCTDNYRTYSRRYRTRRCKCS